jgi:paraquat-inducible protein B
MAARPAIVGAFILGAIGLGIATILFFGGLRLFAVTSRVAVSFEESVAGLDVGAPVTFQGVRVGTVRSIAVRLAADNLTVRVPVILELDQNRLAFQAGATPGAVDYPRLVAAGLRAQLVELNFFTGQLSVDLGFRPGTPGQLVGAVPGLPEIPAVPSDFVQVRHALTKLPEMADSADRALASVERLAQHIDAKLDPLTERANRGVDAATHALNTTDVAIDQIRAEAQTTLRELDALILDTRRQIDRRGGELGNTLASADRVARQAETLLGALNDLAAPRSRFRDDLEATARDLAASAASLRSFARTIERDPSALLMGRPAP